MHSDHHPGPISRRSVLKGGLAAGALLALPAGRALAAPGGTDEAFAADRSSRLLADGTFVIHADMHNHSHLSDGAGDHRLAYASMRDHGLDAACLTDHSTLSWGAMGTATETTCAHVDGDPEHGSSQDCRSLAGLDEERWRTTKVLAAHHDEPGTFAALHGFEWSSPFLGHVNVWGSERWIDPLHTGGVDSSGLGEHLRTGQTELEHQLVAQGLAHIAELAESSDEIIGLFDWFGRAHPARTGMRPFYEWLEADPSTPMLGGGADGIASFNHPGREAGRFSYFDYVPALADRMVAMEILNREEDYLFRGYDAGQPSPLVECLNAGWRVGLIGVTDEHGTDWGGHTTKGRAGLWVRELSRRGVRDALAARRAFATFTPGLRVDAAAHPRPGPGAPPWSGTLGDGWVRMGGVLDHERGPVRFAVDIDQGEAWVDRAIAIQVLRPDDHLPRVVHVEDARIPPPDGDPITFTVNLDLDDGDWVVLRIVDPGQDNPQGIDDEHPGNAAVIAYTSPFWLGQQWRDPLLGGALSTTGMRTG
jgi:hypothetical protein